MAHQQMDWGFVCSTFSNVAMTFESLDKMSEINKFVQFCSLVSKTFIRKSKEEKKSMISPEQLQQASVRVVPLWNCCCNHHVILSPSISSLNAGLQYCCLAPCLLRLFRAKCLQLLEERKTDWFIRLHHILFLRSIKYMKLLLGYT